MFDESLSPAIGEHLSRYGYRTTFALAGRSGITDPLMSAYDLFLTDRPAEPAYVDYLVFVLSAFDAPNQMTIELLLPDGLHANKVLVFFMDFPRAVSFTGPPVPDEIQFLEVPQTGSTIASSIHGLIEGIRYASPAGITRREPELHSDAAGRLFGSSESLLAEARAVLDDEPEGVCDEDVAQLHEDVLILRAVLRSPRPDTLTAERALARITQVLCKVTPEIPALIDELRAGGLDDSSANEVAMDLTLVQQQVARLGEESDSADIAIGRELSEAVQRIDETVAALPEPAAATEPDEKTQIRDAKLRGRLKFWAEVWPEQKAKALVIAGSAGVAAVPQLGIPAAILPLARTILATVFG